MNRIRIWIWFAVGLCNDCEYVWVCVFHMNMRTLFFGWFVDIASCFEIIIPCSYFAGLHICIHRCDKTIRWGNVPWFILLTYEHGCHSWCIHTPFQMVVAGCCWCFFTRFRGKLSIFTETDTFFFALATIVTRHKWYCASVFFHIQKALLML